MMATGYVHTMLDKNQSFPEFVWSCARAFGAFIEMRDDPPGTPIPDQLNGFNDHHLKEIIRLTDKIAELKAMTPQQQVVHARMELDKTIASYEELWGTDETHRARCQAMLAQVQAWPEPSPDHAGLKKFMIEQLTTSMSGSDFYKDELDILRRAKPQEHFHKILAEAERSLKYHTAEALKEEERTRNNNEWVAALRASVPVIQ